MGGREDVPLVDQSAPTVPEYTGLISPAGSPQESQERILAQPGVISSQDEASVRVQFSTLLSGERRPVGGSIAGTEVVVFVVVGVGVGAVVGGGGLLTANLSLLRIADQVLQLFELSGPVG